MGSDCAYFSGREDDIDSDSDEDQKNEIFKSKKKPN